MEEIYQIIYNEGQGELIEKKSKFIAVIKPISSEKEALEIVGSIQKKYYGASHHCYAYTIGDQPSLQRFSDDGEPGGTAGKPMLDVLLGNHLYNVVAVVTRYFGGTLLGKGGLVRAYGGALKEAMHAATIITRKKGVKLHIETNYTGLGKLQYIFRQNGIEMIDTSYTDKVRLYAVMSLELRGHVMADMIEVTNGQVSIIEEESCHFAELDGKVIMLEK